MSKSRAVCVSGQPPAAGSLPFSARFSPENPLFPKKSTYYSQHSPGLPGRVAYKGGPFAAPEASPFFRPKTAAPQKETPFDLIYSYFSCMLLTIINRMPSFSPIPCGRPCVHHQKGAAIMAFFFNFNPGGFGGAFTPATFKTGRAASPLRPPRPASPGSPSATLSAG